jgi:hypothetical protein
MLRVPKGESSHDSIFCRLNIVLAILFLMSATLFYFRLETVNRTVGRLFVVIVNIGRMLALRERSFYPLDASGDR